MKIKSKSSLAMAFITGIGIISQAMAATELRPNLIPLKPYEISLHKNLSTGTVELIFSALTWNAGAGPMEIRGGEVTGSTTQNMYQRVYYSDGTFYNNLAGVFEYHPEHNHFHFDEYAEYRLTNTNGTLIVGAKNSFCLLDTDKIDGRLPGAARKAQYTSCNNVVQGISVGWGDAYRYYVAGQSLDVTNLPKDTYTLSIITDPDNRILETNKSDNVSSVDLDIDVANMTVNNSTGSSDGGSTPGEDITLTQMIPNMIAKGSTVNVTIKGSGFTQGLSITLINGSGPTPILSNIIFVDDSTITMTIHTKKTGSSQLRIWDLQVGSAVLNDAFTIFSTPDR